MRPPSSGFCPLAATTVRHMGLSFLRRNKAPALPVESVLMEHLGWAERATSGSVQQHVRWTEGSNHTFHGTRTSHLGGQPDDLETYTLSRMPDGRLRYTLDMQSSVPAERLDGHGREPYFVGPKKYLHDVGAESTGDPSADARIQARLETLRTTVEGLVQAVGPAAQIT
jgi:hypothetical protein